MENTSLGKYTASFGVSLAITSLLSALLVVLKELSEHTVLAFMKTVTVHHWFTHTLFVLIVFVLLGWGLRRINQRQGPKMALNGFITMIIGAVVVSGLIIAGFFLIMG
ncbi:MAG: hypothetical protein V1742_09190 [Pseudomonadota bacterium]